MEMDTSGLELDAEVETSLQNTQTHLVRKNISLKLKGKGKGGRGGRGGGRGGRGKKDTAVRSAPVSENIAQEVTTSVTMAPIENEENAPPKIEYDEEDIFNMEAPTFTTIDRGPPEPTHRNVKLRWDYDVHLIGQKVLNPLIHVCQKCNIPILLYGRMIPCKHVFCHDCAKKAEKICPRCNDKVSRVEQTGLGTLFMCEHGGAKRNDSQSCSRTYLSQRDLQAHMNHRHLRQTTSSTTVPSTTISQSKSLETQSRVAAAQHNQSQHQPPPLMQPASHHHGVHHPISASNPSSSQQVDYRRGHIRSHMQPQSDLSSYRTPQMSVPPPMSPYSTDHRYDRTNSMVTSTPMALAHQQPPPVMSAYALAMVSQQSQVSQLGVPPIYGTSQIQVVNPSVASTVASNRTNLITVPIHDDSSNAGLLGHAADYLYNPHQMPPPPQQQNYMPPIIPSPYTAPPPISYGGPNSYGSQVVTTAFPPPQAPPPTHYPPPPIYTSQPPNLPPPPLGHHQGLPPRYNAPPTQRYSAPQYEDHTHLGSPQYPPPNWTTNPPPQHPNVPPQLASLAPPQSRPPFYH